MCDDLADISNDAKRNREGRENLLCEKTQQMALLQRELKEAREAQDMTKREICEKNGIIET